MTVRSAMTERERRVLTLVASDVAPIGGMERAAYELVDRLLRRGWRVTVIARSCSIAPSANLRFVRLASPSRPVSLALLCDLLLGSLALRRHRAGIVQTTNAILASRVDVIQAHFCECAFRESGISRSRRRSLAYRINSWLASWIALLLERWCYRPGRVQQIACVSAGLMQDTARCYPRVGTRLCSIPNGVELERFAARPGQRARVRSELAVDSDQLVALFVGGDWHRKGLRHAVAAMAAAQGWTLMVVGDGDVGHFRDLAARLGVEDRVRFAGRLADPAPCFLAADALVAPSYYEAFSLVALEAAAAGLPLIVPKMSGTEELVRDGVTGWFTARDGKAIGARLSALRDDPARRTAMSTAARDSAAAYEWERVVDRFEALYASLA